MFLRDIQQILTDLDKLKIEPVNFFIESTYKGGNEQLGEHKIVQTYFIESDYSDTQNKQQPCYLLTKKGCELYATRMTGAKGTQFATLLGFQTFIKC